MAEIPKACARATFDSIPFTRDNPQAAIAVKEYCKDISRKVAEGIGFYFFSVPDKSNPKGTGNGKTTAACTILNEFIVARTIEHMQHKRLIAEIPGYFVNVSKFQNAYNKQFRGPRDMQEEASLTYYRLKELMIVVELLVMDDIGIRDATDAFKNEFYEVIDERVSEGRATIYTSNEPLSRVAELLDVRITSRIEGSTLPITFKGADKRKGGLFSD
ncbi:hypothetical protein Dtox_1865 [Desulfofarcimen acetoxidans DSM 771]|uniref:IstB-like ATP-binding domain-containing protein n=1 Tax=Desulfofarcimen acetoxidans (strain ATCC 49208 / DSM 771 / KCTC 5769 / VKM B-1644 / 5575) TaxID=485916 RepID=C8VXQ5_DESAS|nr:ATP-binding protein [Desulfofarcimen acetoxidans]ACV62711.1 hypothetical protein Dtox_1865 [Desulfofarcimen acetoxidans DSM 771]